MSMEATAAEEDNSLSLEGSDEDVSFDETPPPTSSISPSPPVPVRILKPGDLGREMDTEINGLAQLTCIPYGSIRIVLDIFKWDKEKILEKTMYGESFLLLREIGIIVKAGNGGQPRARAIPEAIVRRLGDCLMCHRRFGRYPNVQDKVITACDHWFCQRCFQQYVRSEVESGYSSHFKCPYNLCRMFLNEGLVIRFMPGPLLDRFRQLCVEDFVKCSKYRQMCPTIGCKRSAYLDVNAHTKRLEVECDCGATYCFGCGESWHYPLTCEQLKKWLRMFCKIPEYSEVVNIQKNKMPCPHCSVTVDNSAGKVEVTCSTCNYMFCWSCLHEIKGWSEYHRCSTHLNSEIKPEVLGFTAVQRDVERMNEKYAAYAGVDPESKNLVGLRVETASDNLTDRVCNIIFKSQQLLRYTYVYTYFLENSVEKYHFMKLMHKYESMLDTLMEEFESANETNMMHSELEVRTEWAILLHTISDGLEKDLWRFKKFETQF